MPPDERLGRPESAERPTVRTLAQLFERALSYLTNTFASHAHQCADLLERHGFRALLETVIQIEDLSFARREVFAEHPIDELAHQVVVRALLDVLSLMIDAGETLA